MIADATKDETLRQAHIDTATLGELRLNTEYGVIVLAVQHLDGVMQFNPPPTSTFGPAMS